MGDSNVQKQAIEDAQSAFSRLPKENALFRQCISQDETLIEVVTKIAKKYRAHEKKRSTRFLAKFQQHTLWLQNISSIVEVVAQTQAGIACPLWAPIKFVLKISDDHSKALDQIACLIETTQELLPRLEVYQKLLANDTLQISLLRIFTDVVEFAVKTSEFLQRRTLMRLGRLVGRSFIQDSNNIIARLERHARSVSETAHAIEMLRASEHRQDAEKRYHEDMKTKCGEWLRPANIRAVHESQLQTKLEGTCNWVLSDSTFTFWKNFDAIPSSRPLLIISGTHGRGKSILSSAIVTELENHHPTLFFPCSSSDGSRNSTECLLRTLLWQLLQMSTNPKAPQIINEMTVHSQATVSSLWDAFVSLLKMLNDRIYLVIDGIDECVDFVQIISERLYQFFSSNPNIRVLLLGRPNAAQSFLSSGKYNPISEKITITAETNYQDIERFINSEISKSDIFGLPEVRDRVLQVLKDGSDGMFLWVRLMMDDLRKSNTRLEMYERLMTLPRGLKNTYGLIFSRLLQKLDTFELCLVHNLLKFAVISCVPLSFEEVRYAHAIDTKMKRQDNDPQLENCLLIHSAQRLVELCGGLMTINDDKLGIIHSSLKEFLLRPEDEWLNDIDPAISVFRIHESDAHRLMASLCFDYLTENMKQIPLDGSDKLNFLMTDKPFLKYSLLYACYHLNRSGPPDPLIIDQLNTLVESKNIFAWIENFASTLIHDPTLGTILLEAEDLMKWLSPVSQHQNPIRRFETHLNADMALLTHEYGPSDPRVHRLRLVLDLLAPSNVDFCAGEQKQPSEAAENHVKSKTVSEITQKQIIKMKLIDSHTAINRLLILFRSNTAFAPDRQFEVLTELMASLREYSTMTDSLQMLFRLILKHSEKVPVYVLTLIGDFYEKLQKFPEAVEVYTVALARIRKEGVPLKYKLLYEIGFCNLKSQKFAEAIEYLKQAAAEKNGEFTKSRSPWILFFIGDCHMGLMQSSEAMICFQKSFDGFQKLSDHHGMALALISMGDSHFSQYQFKEAIERFTEVMNMSNKLSSDYLAKYLIWAIGRCHFELSNFEKSLLHMQLAYDYFCEEPGDDFEEFVTSILIDCGLCHSRLKQFEDALACEELVYASISRKDGEFKKTSIMSMLQIVSLNLHLRNFDAALKFLEEETRDLKPGPKLDKEVGDILHWRGRCYYYLSNFDMALECFQSARQIYEKVCGKNHAKVVINLGYEGGCYYEMSQLQTSMEFHQDAHYRSIQVCGRKSVEASYSLLSIAYLHMKMNDWQQAIQCFTESLATIEKQEVTTIEQRSVLRDLRLCTYFSSQLENPGDTLDYLSSVWIEEKLSEEIPASGQRDEKSPKHEPVKSDTGPLRRPDDPDLEDAMHLLAFIGAWASEDEICSIVNTMSKLSLGPLLTL